MDDVRRRFPTMLAERMPEPKFEVFPAHLGRLIIGSTVTWRDVLGHVAVSKLHHGTRSIFWLMLMGVRSGPRAEATAFWPLRIREVVAL
jgi:hypothetical protein